VAGNQPSARLNTSTNTSPSQNDGSAMPSDEPTVARRSTQVPRRSAETMAVGTAITSEISNANAARESVTGRPSPMEVATGRLV
jgi:hypothetical protein